MAYDYITKYDFPARTAHKWVAEVFGQGERRIEGDCIHWWGLPEWRQTLHGVCAFFMGQPPAGTSAHYVLTAGVVACGINEADASHANGNSWANAHLVTWECDPNATDGVYATLADAMSDTWIARGYKKPGKIYGHSDFVATQCPGDFDLDRIRREVTAAFNAKLRGVKPAAAQAPQPIELDPLEKIMALSKAERTELLNDIGEAVWDERMSSGDEPHFQARTHMLRVHRTVQRLEAQNTALIKAVSGLANNPAITAEALEAMLNEAVSDFKVTLAPEVP